MADDAVEMKPTLGLTGLTMSPVALMAPALRKSLPANWRPPAGPSLPMRTHQSGQLEGISPVAMLRSVANRMSEAANLDNVLSEVLEFVAWSLTCDCCFIYVLEGDDLVLRASRNPHSGTVNRVKLNSAQEMAGWVVQQRDPVEVSQNASADPHFKLFNQPADDRFEAFLLVPVAIRGRLVGVITAQNREAHCYGEREIGLISTIGFLVGAETEITRLEGQNAELAERLLARTLVERAKGLLQSDLGISEREAYQKIQRQSQQMRKAMKDIAEAIVLSHAVKCARLD